MAGGIASENPHPPAQHAWWPAALTIAGADSSGAAGLAADLLAFAACGVHGAFALTLVSAQNTTEFRAAQPVDAELVAAQIHAVLDDMPVAASKTGLLLTAETVAAVASIAARPSFPSWWWTRCWWTGPASHAQLGGRAIYCDASAAERPSRDAQPP